MKVRTDAFHEAALLTGNCLCNTMQANISEAADFQAELMVSQEAHESQGAKERSEKFGQEATRLTEQLGLEKESNQANSARLRQAEDGLDRLCRRGAAWVCVSNRMGEDWEKIGRKTCWSRVGLQRGIPRATW